MSTLRFDPTSHVFSTLPAILADFPVAEDGPSRDELSVFSWLLVHRGLDLLRVESREQIEVEYFAISKFLASAMAMTVRSAEPEIFGAWTFLQDLLGEAAKRSDTAAVNSILLDSQGHGKRVLEVLAAKKEVSRSEMRGILKISESHLSHLLRELEEADLISRHRNGREIRIELGSAGRIAVRERVLPQWLDLILEKLASMSLQDFEVGDLEDQLIQAGIPSTLAATRVARTIANLATAFAEGPSSDRRAAAHISEQRKGKTSKDDQGFSFFYLQDAA